MHGARALLLCNNSSKTKHGAYGYVFLILHILYVSATVCLHSYSYTYKHAHLSMNFQYQPIRAMWDLMFSQWVWHLFSVLLCTVFAFQTKPICYAGPAYPFPQGLALQAQLGCVSEICEGWGRCRSAACFPHGEASHYQEEMMLTFYFPRGIININWND